MTIKMKNEVELEEIGVDNLMNKICDHFNSISLIESVNPITTASVPVIKIVMEFTLLSFKIIIFLLKFNCLVN